VIFELDLAFVSSRSLSRTTATGTLAARRTLARTVRPRFESEATIVAGEHVDWSTE
jgi:hypothetical protein